ncbi:MAG: SUKH-4 family immunity protein [Lewinellaceae bacterium]|nr:SUKH-4 family immunity protein [Lewinellaceae bacterium]
MRVPSDYFDQVDLLPDTIKVLTEIGLPERFWSLHFSALDAPLRSLMDAWGLEDDRLEAFVLIGETEDGDPVVIDSSHDDILLYFKKAAHFEMGFLNTNVACLRNVLIRLAHFFKEIGINSANRIVDAAFSEEAYQSLLKDILDIDPPIFHRNPSYWKHEMDWLRANQAENRTRNKP